LAEGASGSGQSRRRPAPARDLDEALNRAARHGRAAAAEAIAAARALIEAASLATSGRAVDESGPLGLALRTLDELGDSLSAGLDGPAGDLLRAVSEALDAEIARWEERAEEDSDARSVLRAYLGVREILWELGVRPPRRKGRAGAGPPRRKARVQRVAVDDGT
jgi:hypothetical protein